MARRGLTIAGAASMALLGAWAGLNYCASPGQERDSYHSEPAASSESLENEVEEKTFRFAVPKYFPETCDSFYSTSFKMGDNQYFAYDFACSTDDDSPDFDGKADMITQRFGDGRMIFLPRESMESEDDASIFKTGDKALQDRLDQMRSEVRK